MLAHHLSLGISLYYAQLKKYPFMIMAGYLFTRMGDVDKWVHYDGIQQIDKEKKRAFIESQRSLD